MTTEFRLVSGTSASLPFANFSSFRSDGGRTDEVKLSDSFVLIPKPSESLPIGMWDYYPQAGVFSPGHVDWSNQPSSGKKVGQFKSNWEQRIAVGFWGIQHITSDTSAHRQLGVIIENILGGAKKPEVVKDIERLAEAIFGVASPGPVAPTFSFIYPPLIHAIHDLKMQRNLDQASSEPEAADEIKDLSAFIVRLTDFLLSPTSPLYAAGLPVDLHTDPVNIQGHPGAVEPTRSGPTNAVLTDFTMKLDAGAGTTWEKRMMKAGGSAPNAPFNPSVFTALVTSNSVQSMTQDVAASVNLTEVLTRSPSFTYFDPVQEFPFEMEKDPIFKVAMKELLNPEKPDSLAGTTIGRTLVSKVNVKTIRSGGFSKALQNVTMSMFAPPHIGRAVRSMKKLVTIMGNLER